MKAKTIIISLIVSALCLSASAHKDRIIHLEESKLIGLPEQYQPASFTVTNQIISIGRNMVKITEPIWKRFGNIEEDKIIITSSWYHARTTIPPYIIFSNSKFSIVLNLNTP